MATSAPLGDLFGSLGGHSAQDFTDLPVGEPTHAELQCNALADTPQILVELRLDSDDVLVPLC
ncbi:hypothetical protein KBZ21_44095, partial [Streptomyces sp. A73]|nr:hypothetical protein [Streptomyces sp. A73]